MTAPLIIFGAGGFAREVLQIVLDVNVLAPTWSPLGFMVDEGIESPATIHDLPVFWGTDCLRAHPDAQLVIAVGTSSGRREIVGRLSRHHPNGFATLVHPRAWVGRRVAIGTGSIICAGALITTDIRIGEHVHVNLGCTVGHDSVLGDYVTMSPAVNISGHVQIGAGVEIGTGGMVIPHADVGEWSVVGAGAVVTKTLEANVTAVGAPARVIKTRPAGWHAGSGH